MEQAAPAVDVAAEVVQPGIESPKQVSAPRLPGVVPDDGPSPAGPDEAPAPSSQPKRDASGKFVKSDTAPSAEVVDPTLESSSEADQTLEQRYKSLQGQFGTVKHLANSLGGMKNIAPKFQEAMTRANEWHQEAARLKAELEAAKSGKPAEKVAEVEPVAEVPSVDWKLYAEIKRLANESGEPWKADQWLAEQNEKVVQAKVDKLLADKLKPFEEEKQVEEFYAETGKSIEHLKSLKTSDGRPAYPEFHDEAQAHEVGSLWQRMGLPTEYATSSAGLLAAVALHRMVRSFGSQGEVAAVPANPIGNVEPTDTAAAAALSEGKTAMVRGANGQVSSEAANILAGLRSVEAGSRSRNNLGFEA